MSCYIILCFIHLRWLSSRPQNSPISTPLMKLEQGACIPIHRFLGICWRSEIIFLGLYIKQSTFTHRVISSTLKTINMEEIMCFSLPLAVFHLHFKMYTNGAAKVLLRYLDLLATVKILSLDFKCLIPGIFSY